MFYDIPEKTICLNLPVRASTCDFTSSMIFDPGCERFYKLDNYKDLDRLFLDLVNHYGIEININKWIRAQSNIFNNSIISAIHSLLPARTTLPSVGVLLRPSILEKSKTKSYQMS